MRGKATERTETRVDDLVSGGIGERFNPGHGRLMQGVDRHRRKNRWLG
jgi:hypothetical protein